MPKRGASLDPASNPAAAHPSPEPKTKSKPSENHGVSMPPPLETSSSKDGKSTPSKLMDGLTAAPAKKPAMAFGTREPGTKQAPLYRPKVRKCPMDPENKFLQYWDAVCFIALIFTAFVTPYEVAFTGHNHAPPYLERGGLYFINRFVDALFVVDMFFQFNIQFEDVSGKVIKDYGRIWKKYLTGWFILDLVSVLPYDFMPKSLAKLKALRMIRLARLVKLARLIKSSRLLAKYQAMFAISYSTLALVKFMVLLMLTSHWMACAWGMCASLEQMDTADDDTEDAYTWIKAALGNNSAEHNYPVITPSDQYIVALYWSCMTLTTVGYGDVAAHTRAEYLTAICCMLIGGMVWAYILGSFCGIITQMDSRGTSFRNTMDDLNFMLEDQQIPQEARRRVRQYFYQTEHLEQVKGFGRLLDMMSPRLRGEIAFLSNQEWIMKVWYFQNCSDEFVSELSLCMEAMMFAPKELLDMPATIYIVCNKGIVFRKAQILSQGAVWGLDCILNDLTLMDASVALAMSFVEVAYITRESLTRLIEEYPEEQKRMRKARVKIAILRGLVQAAGAERNRMISKGEGSYTKSATSCLQDKMAAAGNMTAIKRRIAKSPHAQMELLGATAQAIVDISIKLDTLTTGMAALQAKGDGAGGSGARPSSRSGKR